MPYGKVPFMATLTPVKTDPHPFSPAPITAEEEAAMFRAALTIFRLWGVTDDQAAVQSDGHPQIVTDRVPRSRARLRLDQGAQLYLDAERGGR